MKRIMPETEKHIAHAFTVAIAFLEHSIEGEKKVSRRERESFSLVLDIISGKHSYAEFHTVLYGVVGLAMSGTRYTDNKRALFLREWRSFFRRRCPERREDIILVLRRIRIDLEEFGVISFGEVGGEEQYERLPDEWKTLVL